MNLALNLLGLLLTAALVENPFYTRCFMAETVDAQLNERRDVMLPAGGHFGLAGTADLYRLYRYSCLSEHPGGHPAVYRDLFGGLRYSVPGHQE